METVTLYFKQGNSDKVYTVSMEPKGDGFAVNFAYGRRGNTLTTGTKTQAPLPRAKAESVMLKLIKEKEAKGYTIGEGGTAYQHTDKETRVAGILPQLLNEVSLKEAEALIKDPAWVMQRKYDGKRVMIQSKDGVITGINRRGLTIGLPDIIVGAAKRVGRDFIIDGECVGETFHAFDMLEDGGNDVRLLPYTVRLARLENGGFQFPIEIITTAIGTSIKERFFTSIRDNGQEGVVFKNITMPYTPGRPNSGGSQLKYKFYETASIVVTAVNAKRSVAMSVFKEGITYQFVGNVTIPPNKEIPSEGAIIEVRYLYAYRDGALYQPTYLGERDDLTGADCTIDQLKFKP